MLSKNAPSSPTSSYLRYEQWWIVVHKPPRRTLGAFLQVAYSAGGTRRGHFPHGAWSICCKMLTIVNLSKTGIHALHMHTFAQCLSLHTIKLPNCLREIRAEVFVGCKALTNLTLPSSIRYLAYRAFGDCAELCSLEYAWSKQKAWRYPYAADNAFEGSAKLVIPRWLHRIPLKDSDWIAPCN